jgi:hypothetical protein
VSMKMEAVIPRNSTKCSFTDERSILELGRVWVEVVVGDRGRLR